MWRVHHCPPLFPTMTSRFADLLKSPGAIGYIVRGDQNCYNFRSNDLFEIGSLTKLLTADMVSNELYMQTLSLNNTVGDFFPVPKNKDYPTIVELLTHSSGYQKDYFEWKSVLHYYLGIDNSITYPKKVMITRLKKTIPAETDKHYRYSNFGYAVLGMILEKIRKRPYHLILKDYLCKLGMKNTGVNTIESEDYWVWDLKNTFIASGGVTSNIKDLLHFLDYLLCKNTEYTPIKILRYFDSKDEVEEDDIGIGMSWKIRQDLTFYHTGCTENYNSYISVNKEKCRGVVVLLKESGNNLNTAKIIGHEIERFLG